LFCGLIRGIAIGRRSARACEQAHHRSNTLLVGDDVDLRAVVDLRTKAGNEARSVWQLPQGKRTIRLAEDDPNNPPGADTVR
jgi:hypothetical protein